VLGYILWVMRFTPKGSWFECYSSSNLHWL